MLSMHAVTHSANPSSHTDQRAGGGGSASRSPIDRLTLSTVLFANAATSVGGGARGCARPHVGCGPPRPRR